MFYEISKKQANFILIAFCLLHLIFWTLGAELFRGTVTHDTLEGIAWGNQWQLGYHKHPFIAAWLSALATKIARGYVGFPVYLLSQIAIVITFIAGYLLAKKIVPRSYAIISVLLLEGIIYHNINSINFTPDTAQTPIWALTALFFFGAIKRQNFLSWFLVSFFCAIAFLTKYSAIFLFVAMFFVLIFVKEGRKSFYCRWFYCSIIIFLILIFPHLLWVYKQNFSAVYYIKTNYTSSINSLLKHFYYPARYLLGQSLILLGLLILSWPFWNIKFKQRKSSRQTDIFIQTFQRKYVLIMGLTPILLTIFYAFITGTHIIQRWSTPYYYLMGLVFVVIVKPYLTKAIFLRFVRFVFVFFFLVCIGRNSYYIWGPLITKTTRSDVYLPNKEISKKITKIWNKKYKTKLSYIAGDHYLTAFISVYSKDKPIPYMSLSKIESPWINESSFIKKGGIFVFQIRKGESKENLFLEAQKKYPNLERFGILHFEKKAIIKSSPIKILVGILPPKS